MIRAVSPQRDSSQISRPEQANGFLLPERRSLLAVPLLDDVSNTAGEFAMLRQVGVRDLGPAYVRYPR